MAEAAKGATSSKDFPKLKGKVSVTMLPGMRATTLFWSYARIFGPAFAAGISAAPDLQALVKQQSSKGIGEALGELFKLPEEELEALIRRTFELTFFNGQPILDSYDLVFQGKVDQVFAVIAFTLEVNFASFFGGSGGIVAAIRAKASAFASSQTQSPQAGPAGDSSESA